MKYSSGTLWLEQLRAMYLSFLALIVPLTIALFVVVYICGRRYNIRSRERAQAAALNASMWLYYFMSCRFLIDAAFYVKV